MHLCEVLSQRQKSDDLKQNRALLFQDQHIMPRAHRLNEHFTEECNSTTDQGLFHLPSLPPWKTPKPKGYHPTTTKNRYTTPLKRPASLLVYHSQQGLGSPDDIGDRPNTDDVLNIKSLKDHNDLDYDYQPILKKPLLVDSKVQELLQAERAAHCLVFHKKGHTDDMTHYRPDLEWECPEFDEETDIDDNGSILQGVPGCSKEDLNYLLNKNFMSQRPNVRKYDEILSRKVNGLKRFWGDSDLTSTLSRKHIHEQFRHLTDELFIIGATKLQLKELQSEAPSASKSSPSSPKPDRHIT